MDSLLSTFNSVASGKPITDKTYLKCMETMEMLIEISLYYYYYYYYFSFIILTKVLCGKIV